MTGDPVIVSGIKWAEADEALILRLLEQRGRESRCRLSFHLPAGREINAAFLANVVEEPRRTLTINNDTGEVHLRPNEIVTLGLRWGPGPTRARR